jgi:type I restriction enzyme, S subunit
VSALLEALEPPALLDAVPPALVRRFELLATAPGGLTRLRELILSLAVKGKLVPQHSTDGTAEATLKRIQGERDRLKEAGKVKAPKQSKGRGEDERPFDIPPSWEWAPLADLVRVLNGRAYSKQELLDAGPTPVLRVGNLFTSNHWYYSNLDLEPDKICFPGDLLFAWSASFGPFIWDGPKAIFHYHIWKLDPIAPELFDARYFHLFLSEKTAEMKAAGHGVSMVHMTKENMEKIPVPWPPLGEQARIVARVDELMRLCDALEAKGRLEAEQHARLLGTLLGTLTDSSTPEELAANWQRVADHFDLLLDRPEAVDALEQVILQLGLRGVLLPRPSLDGSPPAHGQKRSLQDDPFAWPTVKFGDVLTDLRYGTSAKCSYAESGTPVLRIPNLRDGAIDTSDLKFGDLESKEVENLRLEVGDLLIIRSNGSAGLVGTAALVSSALTGFAFAGYLVRARLDRAKVVSQFMALVMRSPEVRRQIEGPIRTTSGVKNINSTEIQRISFTLPPLELQDLIVRTVTELRRLCAELQERLDRCDAVQAALADAMIDQAGTT